MFISAVPDWAFPWEIFGGLTAFVTFVVMIYLLTQPTPSYTYVSKKRK
jgi:hypothetical protein